MFFDKRPYLRCSHEQGEDANEGALGHRKPVCLLKCKQNGSIQTGFSRAENTHRDGFLRLLTIQQHAAVKYSYSIIYV